MDPRKVLDELAVRLFGDFLLFTMLIVAYARVLLALVDRHHQ